MSKWLYGPSVPHKTRPTHTSRKNAGSNIRRPRVGSSVASLSEGLFVACSHLARCVLRVCCAWRLASGWVARHVFSRRPTVLRFRRRLLHARAAIMCALTCTPKLARGGVALVFFPPLPELASPGLAALWRPRACGDGRAVCTAVRGRCRGSVSGRLDTYFGHFVSQVQSRRLTNARSAPNVASRECDE